MKPAIIHFAAVLIVLSLSASNFAENNDTEKKDKLIMQQFNYERVNSIGKYGFPLTVMSFVKDLGPPDSTFTDDNETCPVGQIHTWCLQSHNLNLLVLGDNYNPKVDYSAESRLFAVAKCKPDKDTGFNGLWGIRLGDSDKKVNEKLSQIVIKNKNSVLKTNIKGSPIHVFLNDFSVSHHHVLQRDSFYFYFMINNNGKLEVILQSSFDLSIVC